MDGRKFQNLKTGEVEEVIRIDESGIAHLSSDRRVIATQLNNKSLYNEEVNLNVMENSFHSSLANNLKNLNTEDMGTISKPLDASNIINPVESHREAQRRLHNDETVLTDQQLANIEERKREVAFNAANMDKNLQSHNSKLEKYLDGDDIQHRNRNLDGVVSDEPRNRNLDGVVSDEPRNRNLDGVVSDERQQSKRNNDSDINKYQETSLKSLQDDPIYTMFSNVKRNVSFKINIPISEKIPSKDFIKMWEENYEKSIIDFLADEFVNNIIENPDNIKELIKKSIRDKVYSKTVRKPKPKAK